MIILKRSILLSFLLLQSSQCIHASESKIPDYLLAYTLCMLTTVAHEAGHAATIKALYDESCDINVGAFSIGSDTVLKIGKLNIKLPFLPYGYVEYYSHGKNHLKDIAIFLSGPFVGSIASAICYCLLQYASPKQDDFQCAKRVTQSMIIGHLLNLIPHPGFDGHGAYEAFKKWRAQAGQYNAGK
jgi:Zn-dependent protease